MSRFVDGFFQELSRRDFGACPRVLVQCCFKVFPKYKLKPDSGIENGNGFTPSILGKIIDRNPSVISSEFVLEILL